MKQPGLLQAMMMFLYGFLMRCLIVYKFWNWFAPMVFFNYTLIDFQRAMALNSLLSLFRTHYSTRIKEEYQEDYSYNTAIFTPIGILIFGWVCYLILR